MSGQLAILIGALGGFAAVDEKKWVRFAGVILVYAAGVLAGFETWGPK